MVRGAKILSVLILALSVASLRASVKSDVVDPYWEVRVKSDLACGSGAVIRLGSETLILTAAHVVKDARRTPRHRYEDGEGATIENYGKTEWNDVYLYKETKKGKQTIKGRVVWYSAPEEEGGHDLALIRPYDDKGLVPMPYEPGIELEDGEDVYYIGTGSGLHARLEKSIVARPLVEVEGFGDFWQSNGNGWFGNSGGPAFVKRDGKWTLAGVVVRGYFRDPKTPLLLELPKTIDRFLKDYLEHRKDSCKKDCPFGQGWFQKRGGNK